MRIAETEKYPHVTYFFSGGKESKFQKENRVLVPSPKVATYDLKPEMSAKKIETKLISSIKNKTYDLIIINFANPDMVGHTGDLKAAIKAVETVDSAIGNIKDTIIKWIPQGHFGEVEDIAYLAGFLCSEKAKYITGQIISVDGGMAI